MKADPRNIITYLGSYLAAVSAVWTMLLWYGLENPWVDRVVIGEIALSGLIVVLAMLRYTPQWKVHRVGVLGFFAAVVLLYVSSQLVAFGLFGNPHPPQPHPVFAPFTAPPQPPATSPYWLRSIWRSMFAVAAPCLLAGYWQWWHDKEFNL